MNLVFACDSVWTWNCEKEYAILKEENPDIVNAARRGSSVVDPETGTRKLSSVGGGGKLSLARRGSQATAPANEKYEVKHV